MDELVRRMDINIKLFLLPSFSFNKSSAAAPQSRIGTAIVAKND
jgi:hypothetical protein